ncbi:hypothetical protein [Sphingomonas sp. LaA6.9]|uniref:hypothetical protein n=1 Tax=Sphingomonas sp. LaA6.9 TaxID=2919914 RepID=UPI001F4FA339|nr:hypothetical protein [Sphingomonas sp. LaA6.9]MCJ8159927.1 hypothetical protein [Sphingomonas sp. LaA6.9]
MAGPLDYYEADLPTAPAPVGEAKPQPSFWNAIAARWDLQDTETDTETDMMVEGYTELSRALREAGSTEQFGADVRAGVPFLKGKIWTEAQRLRAIDPNSLKDFPKDEADLRERMVQRRAAKRAKAQEVIRADDSTSGAIGGFIAGTGRSMLDIPNLATLPVGGFGKTVAKRLLTEAAAGAFVETLIQPAVAQRRAEFGEDYDASDFALNVGGAAVGQAAFAGTLELLFRGGAKAIDLLDPADRKMARALAGAEPEAVTELEVLGFVQKSFGPDRMTSDERAAGHVITRATEVDAVSPFERTAAGDQEHYARLNDALDKLVTDPPSPAPAAAVRVASEASVPRGSRGTGDARATFKASVRAAESSGDDGARNPLSSATGRYQFTNGTWLSFYKRRFGTGGLTDAQILAKRSDGATQDALMDDLTAYNATILARAGAPETAGNLYLLHFAGEDGGMKILRAAADTPIEQVLPPRAIAANPFLKGKSAGDVVDWAHRKMGEVALGDRPRLRAEAFGDDDLALASAQQRIDAAEMERALLDQGARQVNGRDPLEDLPGRIDDSEMLTPWDVEPVKLDDLPAADPVMARLDPAERARIEHAPADLRQALAYQAVARAADAAAGVDARVGTDRVDANVAADAQNDFPISALNVPARGKPGYSIEAGVDEGHFVTAVFRDKDGVARGGVRMPVSLEARELDPDLHSYVDPAFRRQGVASRLYDTLNDAGFDVERLSGSEGLTPDGAAFVNARRTRRANEVSEPATIAGGPAERAQAHAKAELAAGATRAFDDPFGEGSRTQLESLAHDLAMSAEGDARDVRFRLSEGGEELSYAQVMEQLDAEEAAAKAVRACMAPGGGA